MSEKPTHSPIRSFVRRTGRMTPAQGQALDKLWPRYGIDLTDGALDLSDCFGRRAPKALEIGFGDGENLLAVAKAHPDWDFLGFEVHKPGVGRALWQLEAEGIGNARLMMADAVTVLRYHLPVAAVDRIAILFPDPWPKKRHHKRRLIQAGFSTLLASRLKIGGVLHLATDWEEYAQQMLQTLENVRGLENTAGNGQFATPNDERIVTKFERRGQRLGHGVWDLRFKRCDE